MCTKHKNTSVGQQGTGQAGTYSCSKYKRKSYTRARVYKSLREID